MDGRRYYDIATGTTGVETRAEVSRCVVDPKNGGDVSLDTLISKYGKLPNTVEALTGGGGRHLLFTMPEGITINNTAGHLGPGLDTRGRFDLPFLDTRQLFSGAQWKNAPAHLGIGERRFFTCS